MTTIIRQGIRQDWMEANWSSLQRLSVDLGWDVWQREHFLHELPEKWEMSLLAENAGECVGYAIVSRKGRWLWLHHLIIRADHRHQGLGQRLLDSVERQRQRLELQGVRLKVARALPRACDFYQRSGYQPIGATEEEYLTLEKIFPGRHKTIAIHQPNYAPWAGYFHKMLKADDFVFLDDALTSNNSFINRNRIKQHQGELWLTIPVRQHLTDKINEVRCADPRWPGKHLKTLRQYYVKAPYFSTYFPRLEAILTKPATHLAEVNLCLLRQCADWLGIRSNLHIASKLHCEGSADDRLVHIVKRLRGNVYLSGKGGANYQSEAKFREAGLALVYQHFQPPVYPQLGGEFLPGLSVLDLLFNTGPQARSYLEQTDEPKELCA